MGRRDDFCQIDVSGVGNDFERQRRNPVAEIAELQVFEHGVGGAAKRRGRGAFRRGDQRVGQLVGLPCVKP